MASSPSNYEQLLLELINRDRLDPVAAAQRYGTDLNAGLAPGTISTATKQPLAFNPLVIDAARGHSSWMLETDTFSHAGRNGSDPAARVIAAGVTFPGSWTVLENISYYSATGSVNLVEAVLEQNAALFRSEHHRENTLNGTVTEIGLGLVTGNFTVGGVTYPTAMVTEDFVRNGSTTYLTGVIYRDNDNDDFYSVGEGSGGVRVAIGSSAALTWSSGGYSIALTGTGAQTVTFGSSISVRATIGSENAKIDVVDGSHIESSVSLTLLSGVRDAELLGRNALSLTGSSASDLLVGNVGANRITGGAGNDTLIGGAGADRLYGGAGSDTVSFDTASSRVIATLSVGRLGDAAGDRYVSIENMIGSDYADALTGNGYSNRISGGAGNDMLRGGAGNDRISGGSGNDRLYGDAGNDILTGGAGRDNLVGGAGRDTFVFASSRETGDRILDFTSRVDKIQLDHDGFSGMTDTTFRVVNSATPVALHAVQTFLFDTDSHVLRYDADGRGSGRAVVIATLDDVSALRVSDINIV